MKLLDYFNEVAYHCSDTCDATTTRECPHLKTFPEERALALTKGWIVEYPRRAEGCVVVTRYGFDMFRQLKGDFT